MGGVLWSLVGILALAQLLMPLGRRKLLTGLGWLGLAVLAILIAIEDGFGLSVKDRVSSTLLPHSPHVPPWLALAAPVVIPLAVAAGRNLLLHEIRHPAQRLLAVLAGAFGAASIAIDTHALPIWPITWAWFVEEGLELMAGTILAVVLVERLGHAGVCPPLRVLSPAAFALPWPLARCASCLRERMSSSTPTE